jgi:putative phosphoribosyl transferase
MSTLVQISVNGVVLPGTLNVPRSAKAIVLFAHGSGSGRMSPRNNFVADVLKKAKIGTLLMDLLTPEEDFIRENRFDIELLTERLSAALSWLKTRKNTHGLKLGLFGASTGAAAALQCAAREGETIFAVVSRGGRPDLAKSLELVKAPTLLLVGGNDTEVIQLNELAFAQLLCPKKLSIIPGATHLFEEPGTLEEVARQASEWFVSAAVAHEAICFSTRNV